MGSRLAKVANQHRMGIRYVAKGISYKDMGIKYGTKMGNPLTIVAKQRT